MTIKRLLLLICAVTGTIMCRAQVTELPQGKSRAVNSTDYYVSPSNYDYKPIAKQITRGTPSNYEKAKLIFLWICENIKYDTKTDIRTADVVLGGLPYVISSSSYISSSVIVSDS